MFIARHLITIKANHLWQRYKFFMGIILKETDSLKRKRKGHINSRNPFQRKRTAPPHVSHVCGHAQGPRSTATGISFSVPRFALIAVAAQWIHRMDAQLCGDALYGWAPKTSHLLQLDGGGGEGGGARHGGSEGLKMAQKRRVPRTSVSTPALMGCSGTSACVPHLTCCANPGLFALRKLSKDLGSLFSFSFSLNTNLCLFKLTARHRFTADHHNFPLTATTHILLSSSLDSSSKFTLFSWFCFTIWTTKSSCFYSAMTGLDFIVYKDTAMTRQPCKDTAVTH